MGIIESCHDSVPSSSLIERHFNMTITEQNILGVFIAAIYTPRTKARLDMAATKAGHKLEKRYLKEMEFEEKRTTNADSLPLDSYFKLPYRQRVLKGLAALGISTHYD